MKITVIIASPRGMKGNTGCLLDQVMAGLEPSAQVELLDLSRLTVRPCSGCDHCHKTGSCHMKDDYETIKQSLLSCDGFILASPNYIFSVTAQLKALFDRSGNLIHCLKLEGKYAALVETSGGGEDEEVLSYMTRFVNATGAQSVGGIGSPMAGDRQFPQQEQLFKQAGQLGTVLCSSIREQRTFPEQDTYRQGFKARMQYLVNYRKADWDEEYCYWQKHHLSGDPA